MAKTFIKANNKYSIKMVLVKGPNQAFLFSNTYANKNRAAI